MGCQYFHCTTDYTFAITEKINVQSMHQHNETPIKRFGVDSGSKMDVGCISTDFKQNLENTFELKLKLNLLKKLLIINDTLSVEVMSSKHYEWARTLL